MRATQIIIICQLVFLSACTVDTDGYTFISHDSDTTTGTASGAASDDAVVVGSDSDTTTNTTSGVGFEFSSDSSSSEQSIGDTGTYADSDTNSAVSDEDASSGSDNDGNHDSEEYTDSTTSRAMGNNGDTDTSEADTTSASDAGTGTEINVDTVNLDINDTVHVEPCVPGVETQRICNENGNVKLVDNCGDTIDTIECASPHGACKDGVCGCESGWTNENCERCLVYVNGGLDNYDGHDGRSWEMSVKNIQDALNISESGGCEIWVAQGTYLPTKAVDSADPRTVTFQMISGVDLFGGFTGNEQQRTERDYQGNPTILSGDIGVIDDVSDNAYHVIMGANNATLDGFTITGGIAGDDGNEGCNCGGGMQNLNASPIVANCKFINNDASNYDGGGGMCNISSSPTVSNCVFESNYSWYGGGISNIASSTPIVSNCVFKGNVVMVMGGGMRNRDSSPIVVDSVFMGNEMNGEGPFDGGGGGMNNENASPVITNCIFLQNTVNRNGAGIRNENAFPTIANSLFVENAASGGGGVTNGSGSSPSISNCTFVKNNANRGGAIANFGDATPIISNSILWANTASDDVEEIFNYDDGTTLATVSYSLIAGGYTGTDNLDANPLFIDAEGGDYRLTADSPCINAGSTNALLADDADLDGDDNTEENLPFDLDGNPRTNGDSVDMGAFEYWGE